MLRFHNKIANELGDLNPNWTDDSLLFEEARRIVIACLQQIVFQHFLPNLVGECCGVWAADKREGCVGLRDEIGIEELGSEHGHQ